MKNSWFMDLKGQRAPGDHLLRTSVESVSPELRLIIRAWLKVADLF